MFATLATPRKIQRRSAPLPTRNVIRQLRPLRSATITANGAAQIIPPQIDPDRRAIVNALATRISKALSE